MTAKDQPEREPREEIVAKNIVVNYDKSYDLTMIWGLRIDHWS